MTIRLSRRALGDIAGIKKYTIEQWGEAAWLRYFAALAAGLDRVAHDPDIGRPRDTLLRGMRSLTCEKHLIFFMPAKVAGGRTAVLRIVHQARNLPALIYAEDLE